MQYKRKEEVKKMLVKISRKYEVRWQKFGLYLLIIIINVKGLKLLVKWQIVRSD